MKGIRSSIESVAADLPTLERSLRLQETASAAGLDWPDAEDVWSRINEELAEAKAASEDFSVMATRAAAKSGKEAQDSQARESVRALLEEELGDLLFAVVDVCRKLGVNPDRALSRSNDIFRACVDQLERKARSEGRMLALDPPAAFKRLWDQTKKQQRASNIIWANAHRPVDADDERRESAHA